MKVHELRKGATYTNASGKARRVIVSIVGDTRDHKSYWAVYYNDNRGNARKVFAETFARWAAKEVKP